MLPRHRAAVLLISAVLTTAPSAHAADWLGGSGLFSDPSKWSPTVPGPTDPANFPTGGIVQFTTNPSTDSLTVSGGSATFTLAEGSTGHVYSLLGTAPTTLSVNNATLSASGGSITLPNAGGVSVSNATVTLSNTALLSHGLTTVANHSDFFINAGSSLTTSDLAVGTAGSGTLTLATPFPGPQNRATATVAHDITISTPTPNAVAQLDVKTGDLTVGGTIYVGGTAAGPQGNGVLQANSYPGTFTNGIVTADALVVYPKGFVLTNACSNIFTRVATIAGDAQFVSLSQSGGGLRASESVALLPGSHTYVETSIASPLITVSPGAVLSARGLASTITGNLTNGGQLIPEHFNIFGSYTQRSSGLLAGTLGTTPLLDLFNGTATLAGTLSLTVPASLTLHPGDSFPVIRASALFGNFDTIQLVGSNAAAFTGIFNPATGQLTVTVPEPLSLVLLPAALLALSLRLDRRHRFLS